MPRLGLRSLLIWVNFIVLLATLCACGAPSVLPPPTRTDTPSLPTVTYLPASPTSAVSSSTPSATRQEPTTAAMHTPAGFATLRADTPTPQPPSPITPQNTSQLQTVKLFRYSPWDLVLAAAWSPDGRWLAAAAGEHVHLYDGRTLEQAADLDVGVWANSLVFYQYDGLTRLALAAKDGSLQAWEIPQGRQIFSFAAHRKGANSLAVSPDGSRLASTGNDAIVRLWDLATLESQLQATPQPLAELIGGAFAVPAIRFSPDGSLLASVDGHVVRLRQVATQQLVHTLYGENSIFDIAFSPDGRWLAGGQIGDTLRLWDTASGETLATWQKPHPYSDPAGIFLWSIAFNLSGDLLASGGSDRLVTLWNPASGEILAELSGHTGGVSCVAFSPDGVWLASGGMDASLRLWTVKPGTAQPPDE